MEFSFSPGEKLPDAVHRVGQEQLGRALQLLKSAPPEKAIHESRKSLKRLRALLRLVRSGLGEASFKRENHRLRDIARTLSGARDGAVLRATALRLAAARPDLEWLPVVVAPASDASEKAGTDAIIDATAGLKRARKAWGALELDPPGFATVTTGLERGLRAVRDAAADAQDGAEEAAHEWRKALQRHWRHMRLLEPAWPAYFKARAETARAASDLLGEAQDLALMNAALRAHKDLDDARRDEALSAIRAFQAELHASAHVHSARLTVERPRSHARRAAELWELACRSLPGESPLKHAAEATSGPSPMSAGADDAGSKQVKAAPVAAAAMRTAGRKRLQSRK